MKKIITITFLVAVFAAGTSASGYEDAMSENIGKMYQSTNVAELTNLANQFSRIANVEKSQWLPSYYGAFCHLRTTYLGEMEAVEIHKQLDLAQAELEKAKKIAANESEIHALQAHIYQLRITDMNLGMKYSGLATESLTIAEKLGHENPRVYYLKGMNIFHTPEMFGGGAKNARPLLEKASQKFKEFTPENKLMPDWGKEHNAQMLEQCNSEE